MIVNGVALPDIPDKVLELSQYYIIHRMYSDTSEIYSIRVLPNAAVYFPPGMITEYGTLYSPEYYTFNLSTDGNEWIDAGSGVGELAISIGVVDGVTDELLFSNHDIYEVTSVNAETGEFTKGEIYFPNSEAEEEPEETKPPRYSIATAILDDIAHAIQEKKNTTAVFTPESMPGEIRGIVSGGELPNAEDALWGTVANYEYGITSSVTSRTNANKVHDGRKFKVNYTISFVGFRYYPCSTSSCVLTLYDADTQEVLERVTVTPPVTNEWVNYVLPEPRNLDTEKSYMISIFSNGNFAELSTDKVKYNNKITVTGNTYSYSADVYPQSSVYNTGGVDMLIGEIVTETIPTEYKIQLGTMTSIADEVMRIVGSDVQMSTEQIITALQSVEAQTATTEE